MQFDRDRREIVDEIERVLDLVSDTGGQLAERGELLGLHQAILRGLQILQRLGQFAGAGFDALEQAHILDCNRSLVSEGRHQLDLLVGEGPNLYARQCKHADCCTLAKHRHSKYCPEAAQPLGRCKGVVRVGLNIRNVDRTPDQKSTARR